MLCHTITYRVKYAETDKMGVVYYGRYFEWFEAGRNELLRAQGLPYTAIETRGIILPVIEASAQYRQPARYDELVTVVTTIPVPPRVTITLDYDVRNDAGASLVTGRTVHSFVKENGRPTRAPQWVLDALT